MLDLLIIADDFTGAVDAGAQFANVGIPTCVIVSNSMPEISRLEGLRVLSIDAETRHLPPNEAYAITWAIANQAIRLGVPIIMKKVDSTLRGQIGSELAALSDASGGAEVAFLPAFPEAGRTTKNGIQLVNGIPVNETEFSADLFEPVLHTSIKEMIRAQNLIDVTVVTEGKQSDSNNSRHITVYDVYDREMMADIVRCLYENNTRLWAGCAGLAKELAQRMRRGEMSAFQPRMTNGIFVACGSLNPVAHKQIHRAVKSGFELITLTQTQKLQPNLLETAQGAELLKQLRDASVRNGRVILSAADGASVSLDSDGESFGYSNDETRVRISSRIGELTQAWMKFEFNHTILATGGDTLLAIMKQLNVTSLLPICELEAGVICSTFAYGAREWQLISKAGGYGAEDTIVKLANRLMEKSLNTQWR